MTKSKKGTNTGIYGKDWHTLAAKLDILVENEWLKVKKKRKK